jgi:hypothetical protein
MSATSQAFQHWHDCQAMANVYGENARREAGKWARRLPNLVHEDFPVASHIRLRAAGPLMMECTRCDTLRITIRTAHMVGDFLDAHNHCQELEVMGWLCKRCNFRELPERTHCRMCEGERTESHVPVLNLARREFQLWRSELPELVGSMRLGSLREALRAGRAILWQEEFRVVLGPGLSWGGDHECM